MGGRLTEQRIAQAALELIDADGIDALSMRRLAQRLATAPMSIYTYFPDKEAVLDGAAQLLLAEIPTPPADAHWRDAIGGTMRALREVALRHRNAAVLIHRFPPRTPDATAFVEVSYRSLRRAGFDELSTARCYRAVAAYTLGSLDLELGEHFSVHLAPSEGADDSLASFAEQKLLPLARTIKPVLREQDDADEFEYGLDLIVDGFADAMARVSKAG